MIRPAFAGDEAILDGFLAQHAESSMFLRSNLVEAGLGNQTHPHGTTYLMDMRAGVLRGVFGLTNEGFAMCQAPGADQATWAGFVAALTGRDVKGITGDDAQVSHAIAAMGLAQNAFLSNATEPLYRLDLAELVLPVLDNPEAALPLSIRPPEARDIEILTLWYLAYGHETGVQPEQGATEKAIERAMNAINGDITRVLIHDGRPVAMTAFNAQFQDMVQIGGVYTPDQHRNKGYARYVVAAHLTEARKTGAKTAVLFANNSAAARAYEAIGFQHIGRYRVAVLKETHRLEPQT